MSGRLVAGALAVAIGVASIAVTQANVHPVRWCLWVEYGGVDVVWLQGEWPWSR